MAEAQRNSQKYKEISFLFIFKYKNEKITVKPKKTNEITDPTS